MNKKSRKTLKYLGNEKRIKTLMKKKTFFIIFEGLSFARNCLRPESVPLNCYRDPQYYGLCKEESGKACVLVLTHFNSFPVRYPINYITNLFQKFHFPIEVAFNSL